MKNWSPLHHQVWRELRSAGLVKNKSVRFLICVSGGADSMALLHVFKDLPVQIEVFHAHHGPGSNCEYRDLSAKFVETFCLEYKISFRKFVSSKYLKSENDMRKFRREQMFLWQKQNPQGVIVTAHHAQDLLETRILRLIRGTGPDGLRSMSFYRPPFFRPFLDTNPNELRKFLLSRKWEWCEDPSNQDPRYLRNWLRTRWLPMLEKRRPGSISRLSSSLESLIPETTSIDVQNGLNRAEYISMSPREQLQALAQLLRGLGVVEFTQGQLKEVQKRLDNPGQRLTFKTACVTWLINAQRIVIQKAESDS